MDIMGTILLFLSIWFKSRPVFTTKLIISGESEPENVILERLLTVAQARCSFYWTVDGSIHLGLIISVEVPHEDVPPVADHLPALLQPQLDPRGRLAGSRELAEPETSIY